MPGLQPYLDQFGYLVGTPVPQAWDTYGAGPEPLFFRDRAIELPPAPPPPPTVKEMPPPPIDAPSSSRGPFAGVPASRGGKPVGRDNRQRQGAFRLGARRDPGPLSGASRSTAGKVPARSLEVNQPRGLQFAARDAATTGAGPEPAAAARPGEKYLTVPGYYSQGIAPAAMAVFGQAPAFGNLASALSAGSMLGLGERQIKSLGPARPGVPQTSAAMSRFAEAVTPGATTTTARSVSPQGPTAKALGALSGAARSAAGKAGFAGGGGGGFDRSGGTGSQGRGNATRSSGAESGYGPGDRTAVGPGGRLGHI
jgi:hypothetical protein